MISDEERREVARMLRELSGDSTYPDLIGVIADHDGWYPAADAADRLADLIEPPTQCPYYHSDRHYCSIHDVPATPQKVAEEMFGKMCHSTKEEADTYDAMLKSKSVELHPVDRDALLALADEMEQETGSVCGVCMGKTARRIREALGVEC